MDSDIKRSPVLQVAQRDLKNTESGYALAVLALRGEGKGEMCIL